MMSKCPEIILPTATAKVNNPLVQFEMIGKVDKYGVREMYAIKND
jgi:hypothetical protein